MDLMVSVLIPIVTSGAGGSLSCSARYGRDSRLENGVLVGSEGADSETVRSRHAILPNAKTNPFFNKVLLSRMFDGVCTLHSASLQFLRHFTEKGCGLKGAALKKRASVASKRQRGYQHHSGTENEKKAQRTAIKT